MKPWPNKRVERTAARRLGFDIVGFVDIIRHSLSARSVAVAHSCRSAAFARHAMKTTITLAVIFGALLTARAQSTFSSSLSPIVPTPENSWFRATGEFSVDGASTSFAVTFGLEAVIPSSARLVGMSSDFTFDLGSAHIAVHSPGPWPNGYDGATFFYGSFLLPDALRDDFLGGRTTLLLTGSRLGDFQGAVVPVPEPSSVALIVGGLTVLVFFRRIRFQR